MTKQDADFVAQINSLYIGLSPYGRLVALRVIIALSEQYQYLAGKNKPPVIPAIWHFAKGE